jgi:transcription elongation factor GreB
MSKAFTRESDDAPEEFSIRPSASLPPGAKNYITQDGERRLRSELEELLHTVRPTLAALPAGHDAKAQLQALDARIRQTQQILQSAVVVAPPGHSEDKVRFGATVAVRHRDGGVSEYRIVGADETDIDRGWVSWMSPIAKALLNRKTGDSIRFKFPSGEEALEILSVSYGQK